MKSTGIWLLALAGVLYAVPAQAQLGALEREIDALREDIQVLQRQAYRDKEKGIAPASAQDVAVKMGEFDETLRQAVGHMDELDYKFKKLNERIDVINKDIDIRLKMLEGKPLDSGLGAANPEETKKFGAVVATDAPKSIVGDSITKGDDLPAVKTQSVEDLYKAGMAALNANDSDLAAQKFTAILTKFPNDKLAGNAQYWLGEAYYAKKDYAKAAVAFAKGYEKFKDGVKAPDNILKLGMSMKELGKKTEACTAFLSLPKEFPKAEQSLKDKAKKQAEALSCK